MLANLFILGATSTIVKIYNGKEIDDKMFNSFDEAINFMVYSDFKLKSITENDSTETYSYWFEK